LINTNFSVMANSKLALAVGLATTTLLMAALFAVGLLLSRPSFTELVAQAGLITGSARAWVGPVFGIGAILFAAGAFAVSLKQRSFAVSWLLAVSGIVYMIPGLIALADVNFAVILFPGPIVAVIFGLVIFGLGALKGIRTAMTPAITVARYSGGAGN
jgi:hypothetical protein